MRINNNLIDLSQWHFYYAKNFYSTEIMIQHAFGKEIVYNENKIQMTRKTLLGVFQGLYLLNIPFYT